MVLCRSDEIKTKTYDQCHNGKGLLYCKSLLDGFEKSMFSLMHYDDIRAGVSIGEHLHTKNEEIYFLLSGTGTLIFDGEEYDMNPGDVSLCTVGHSHGFIAKTDCIMIVVRS